MSIKSWILSTFVALAAGAAGQYGLAADKTTESGDKTTQSVPQATQAHLGLGVSSVPLALSSHLPGVLDKGRGVLVVEVTEASPAQNAGLRKHDVVIRYDDQDLDSPEQLVNQVRNEKPGTEIQLEYVRGGKVGTVKVTLGEREVPAVAPRDWPRQLKDWPDFSRRFNFPMMPFRPDFFTEQDDLGVDGTEWTDFQSMSISKDADGTYHAKVKYKSEDGSMVNREYTGTRQDVRDAIQSDAALPDPQKQQLLRSLDDRLDNTLQRFQFPKLPALDGSRRFFDWPNVDL